MKKAKSPPSPFHVGDRVRNDWGKYKTIGVIKEDLGNLGINGRRLFMVDFPMALDDSFTTMLSEDEIEKATPDMELVWPNDSRQTMEYLVHGGLISILNKNMSDGILHPRSWLYISPLGNIAHTSIPDRGMIGGQFVPYWALYGNKILASKRDEVATFLTSFRLIHEEAEKVMSKVGISRKGRDKS